MPTSLDNYPVVLSQDLIWRDMDAYQHVNNAVYFRYFEDARMAYFGKIGAVAHKDRTGIGPILASTKCDFRAPLTYPDRIGIGASVGDIQAKKITMNYIVYSQSLERVAAEGSGLIVYYDYGSSKSCEIPAEILSAIQDLEARAGQ